MTKEELTFYLAPRERVDGNARSSSTAQTIIMYHSNAPPPVYAAILF